LQRPETRTLWHITCDLRCKMRPIKLGVILLIFAAVSCGRQQKMQRDQQNYDVVQEGATGTATSTIAAPGETAGPMTTSATATNVDTTTAFTLPETVTTTSTAPPGTIAGSLPTTTGGSIGGYAPRPAPRPRVERPPDQPMNSSTSTAPPTTTDTASPTTPPPPTATTATSTQG